jgi:hypothetical protein
MLQIVVSLTDDTKGIIYDRNIFIIQAIVKSLQPSLLFEGKARSLLLVLSTFRPLLQNNRLGGGNGFPMNDEGNRFPTLNPPILQNHPSLNLIKPFSFSLKPQSNKLECLSLLYCK